MTEQSSAPATVYNQFREAASEVPAHSFLCYPPSPRRAFMPEGREYSYHDALAIVDDLATRYARSGYGPGHRVALLAGNRPDHFWHLLALNAIGASAVLLNPEYLNEELVYGIVFPDCALAVGIPARIDDLRFVSAGFGAPIPVVDVAAMPELLPPPGRPPAALPAGAAEREALVIYTSGITGLPKGCIISNLSCLAAGENYGTAGGLISLRPRQERLYIPLPSFHMNVSVFTLNTMTRLRGCIILQDRFSASSWWPDIAATRATCLHYLGIIPPMLVKAPVVPEETLHRVRFGLGAGIDPLVREQFEARFGFPLIEAWGMTETSRAIQNCDMPRCLEGRALGRPRKSLEVMVADEQDQPVSYGTPGELLVRAEGTQTAGVESGARAFAAAGVTPADVKYLSAYDSFTITVLLAIEDLGFCDKGDGGGFVADGKLIAGVGRLPVNTDGGGLCNNHPAHRGGMTKVIEAVRQLRGEAHPAVQVRDCDLAVAHGTGGMLDRRHGCATIVLERI